MGAIVAIDIGGTTIKSAVAEVPGRLSATTLSEVHRTPTPVGDADALVAAVVSAIEGHGVDATAVGVVMPGLLDEAAGVVRVSGNLRLQDAPIAPALRQALSVPVSFGHDVRAAALAELHCGAARGLRDAAVLPIGTGIAVALIIDGEVRSADGRMGEIGHVHVGPDVACVCGRHGCLEAVASAAAIARRYREATGRTLDAAGVLEQASQGEDIAGTIWRDAVDGLATACAMLSCITAPEAIVLGGGLSRAGEALLAPLRTGLAARLSYQPVPELRVAHHGDDASCLGAALMALRDGGIL